MYERHIYRLPEDLVQLCNLLHDQEVEIDKDNPPSYGEEEGTIKIAINMIEEEKKARERKGLLVTRYHVPMSRCYVLIRGVTRYEIERDEGIRWYNLHGIRYDVEEKRLVLETTEGTRLVVCVVNPVVELVPTNESAGHCIEWRVMSIPAGRKSYHVS